MSTWSTPNRLDELWWFGSSLRDFGIAENPCRDRRPHKGIPYMTLLDWENAMTEGKWKQEVLLFMWCDIGSQNTQNTQYPMACEDDLYSMYLVAYCALGARSARWVCTIFSICRGLWVTWRPWWTLRPPTRAHWGNNAAPYQSGKVDARLLSHTLEEPPGFNPRQLARSGSHWATPDCHGGATSDTELRGWYDWKPWKHRNTMEVIGQDIWTRWDLLCCTQGLLLYILKLSISLGTLGFASSETCLLVDLARKCFVSCPFWHASHWQLLSSFLEQLGVVTTW